MNTVHITWRRRGAVAVTLAMLLAGCAGPAGESPPPPTAAGEMSGYRLGSGDQIRMTVYGEPNLSGEFTVDGGGNLALPLVGKMPAQGMTASELAQKVADRLSPEYLRDPNVSVEVMTYRPFYIVGEVKKPGSYPYVNGMSVINAVALAGGFTYRARDNAFDIDRTIKGQQKRFSAGQATEVLPGDVITVRERYF